MGELEQQQHDWSRIDRLIEEYGSGPEVQAAMTAEDIVEALRDTSATPVSRARALAVELRVRQLMTPEHLQHSRVLRGLRLACRTLARERMERWADETGEAVDEDGVRLATADVMREIMGQVDRKGEQWLQMSD